MIPGRRTNPSFRPSYRRQGLLLLVLDACAIFAVFNFIAALRGLSLHGEGVLLIELIPAYLLATFALYLIDGYTLRTDMTSLDYASQHLIALTLAGLAALLLTFAVIPSSLGGDALRASRGVIVFSFLTVALPTLGYRRMFRFRQQRRHGLRSIVFVGPQESYEAFAASYQRSGMTQPLIATVVENLSNSPFQTTVAGHLTLEAVLARIERGELGVEAIVLRESGRDLETKVSEQLLALYFGGVPTYTVELFNDIYWRKIPLYRINQTWLFQEGFQIARVPVFARVKRVSDILLSTVGLIVTAPVLALAALAIWIEDRGPIFFRQSRTGLNREPFELVKLRSMHVSKGGGELYTLPGDSRITRVGAFLRTTRIDELPQLLNVLRGEMSLIGPRAEWTRLVETYQEKIQSYHYRHLVKPGITGWAQVNYPYGASLEDTRRKLEYDLYYVKHFSFVMDAAIVLKTIHVMVFGKGR
ncbi:MAG TPA: exopolysaccharide biosynthesis polyprenyl glycosylphosphotransferase [Opitutaceae bacterium]